MVTQVRGHSFDASAPGTDAEQWRRAMAGSTRPPLTLDGVRRIVVVGAHPDDESLGSAGLVAGARDAGIEGDIRFRHHVKTASWSSADARWTVEALRTDTNETVRFTCGWSASGMRVT